MKKIVLLFYFFILAIICVSCAVTNDPAEIYKDKTPGEIYREGKANLKDRDYSEAIKHFEALDVQYPFSPETADAQLYLIYAYYMKEDYALAVNAADHFIAMHPGHPHVDYAYYMRGINDYYQNLGLLERIFSINLATRDVSQIEKCYGDFNEVVSRFPESKYAPPAHQYMVHLRNVMADHELEIARFYFAKGAYVASANRANNVIAHYQESPAVIPALKLSREAYHHLGMRKLEEDTLKVMAFNGINP